eukprot:8659390-Pyramimonas_sp.AAC.1
MTTAGMRGWTRRQLLHHSAVSDDTRTVSALRSRTRAVTTLRQTWHCQQVCSWTADGLRRFLDEAGP